MPPADNRIGAQCPHCHQFLHLIKGTSLMDVHFPYCEAIAADPSIMDRYTRPEDGELCAITRS